VRPLDARSAATTLTPPRRRHGKPGETERDVETVTREFDVRTTIEVDEAHGVDSR
jgi:hypothetical protein